MKVIITIQHPAHVHFFKNAIRELEDRGDEVRVYVRAKDIALELLEELDIDHEVLASHEPTLSGLAIEQAKYEARLLRRAWEFDPDVMMAIGEPAVAHVSKLVGSESILFVDTENAKIGHLLGVPFADRVCTPVAYQDDHGANQIRYQGYHELAYLHPNHFEPDPSVLDEIGADESDTLVVLRLNAWESSHDLGDSGLDSPMEVIERLEDAGARVLLTSEPDLPGDFDEYRVDIPYRDMHDLMYYADLLIGESATMAAESAVLGTPAVFISTSRRGYTDELGDRYGLCFTFSGSDRQRAGVRKAVQLLEGTGDEKWERRRERILKDKVDTTEFILEQLNSPSSVP